MPNKRKQNKKIKRGAKRVKARIVRFYLEKRKRGLLEKHWKLIDEAISESKKIGVYGLYDKGGNLYYLGVARKNIVQRLLHHLKDRHANKWRYFSFYVCDSLKQISALETLFLRLTRPRGNKIAGRFKGSENIENRLKHRINEAKELIKRV